MKIINDITKEACIIEPFLFSDLRYIKFGLEPKITSEDCLVDNIYSFCKEFISSTGKSNDPLNDLELLLLNSIILYKIENNDSSLNIDDIKSFLLKNGEKLDDIFYSLDENDKAKISYIYFSSNDLLNESKHIILHLLKRFDEINGMELYKVLDDNGKLLELISVNRLIFP